MKSLEYFSIKNFNIDIPINISTPINIISYTCDEAIIDWNIKYNCAKLNISLCFKILYTTKESQSLNILKHNSYCYDVIHLQNKIDGLNLHKLVSKKRIYPLCNLDSLSLTNYNKDYISFSLLMINEIKIIRSLSVLYTISETNGDCYLYASDIFLNNFTQLTFSPKYYHHICFSSQDDSIFYYNNSTIYCYSLHNNSDTPLLEDNFLCWFCNIEANKFLICRCTKEGYYILTNDIVKKQEMLVYKCELPNQCSSFVFASNIISFIQSKNDIRKLIILNIYGDIIFNTPCNCNKLFMNCSATTVIGSNDSALTIIDIKKKSIEDLYVPLPNFIVKDIIFSCDNKAIISGLSNDISYVLLFNIETLLFKELLSGTFTISSIDIDDLGNIFLSSNELGLFNIYTLNENGNCKLSAKLFANNLSILIRK